MREVYFTYSVTCLRRVRCTIGRNVVVLVAVTILRLEALQVTEVMVVDDADQAIKLLDVVLQRSGCKEELVAVGKGSLQAGSHRRR